MNLWGKFAITLSVTSLFISGCSSQPVEDDGSLDACNQLTEVKEQLQEALDAYESGTATDQEVENIYPDWVQGLEDAADVTDDRELKSLIMKSWVYIKTVADGGSLTATEMIDAKELDDELYDYCETLLAE
jgi:hypothetical protein